MIRFDSIEKFSDGRVQVSFTMDSMKAKSGMGMIFSSMDDLLRQACPMVVDDEVLVLDAISRYIAQTGDDFLDDLSGEIL